jgi:hypothetical protein
MQFIGSRILLGLSESVTDRIKITENYRLVNPWVYATQVLYSPKCRREHVKNKLEDFSSFHKSYFQTQKPTVKDLINALPSNNSVNTVQNATIEEAVFSVDQTDAPLDWLDSDHVICVYCRSMSVPRLYKEE